MKKLLSLLLAAVLALGLGATALATDATTTEAEDTGNYKIAILTGTTSQSEEEIRAAERALAADPDHIITDTYPDNFMSEQETTVAKLLAFASDPEVKAIVMCQGVPGAKAGFDKIREIGRDDILLIVGVPQEDPAIIAEAADIVLYADEARQGDTIMQKCAEWGVDVFLHYSFPRHMAIETIVARYNVLTANAEALGIEFVDVNAPDPTGDAGTPGAQQFILEDIPQQMEKYAGKKVAVFSTNCAMQDPMQAAVLEFENAYYPQPCCPSPYHAFPSVLGLELNIGDDDVQALTAVAKALDEKGAASRMSTWPSPVNMALIDVGVAYAYAYINGEVEERNNSEKLISLFDEAIESGSTVTKFTNADGETIDNYYTVLLSPVDFNDYL